MSSKIEEIKYWQSNFRILKDWKIDYDNKCEYTGQSHSVAVTKLATIYSYGRGRPPKDYIFHEILHICFKEIWFQKDYKKRKLKEELYIQDLCQIFMKVV